LNVLSLGSYAVFIKEAIAKMNNQGKTVFSTWAAVWGATVA